MQKNPSKNAKKQAASKLFMLLIFLVGLLVMTYPFYSNALNDFVDQRRLEQVQEENRTQSKVLAEKSKEEMKKRNEELAVNGLVPSADPFDDNAESRIASDEYASEHLIGAVSIPAIRITIPLFDLTNDQLLQIGATVLQGTSYPTGGSNTHSVISAHSGLPEKKLFTDLEEVAKGEIFVLTVFNEKLAYEVEDIQVVKPNDTSSLKVEADRDVVTLLTCTPYMINSHRLLVKGHRVPYTGKIAKQVEKADNLRQRQNICLIAIIIIAIVLLLSGMYKVIYGYSLKKRYMDITLQCTTLEGLPMAGLVFELYNSSGKKAIIRNHLPVTSKTDEFGRATFKNLPGAIYSVKESGSKARLKVGIKKRKQKNPLAYPTKKQQVFVSNQEKNIQIKK
ncbi:class C sortase [Enterococcus sp. 669A]|uniref:Class C sortase n=1 Tax=Candidatus Enterococcus moelleringii TaxID=2815325 RepID=A0ABS3LFC3_9ENTE|nr:class C sortase [Enterococcus sp. 669A]MBO1308339.1 class C sortase [Enterococcus sp. 669A]